MYSQILFRFRVFYNYLDLVDYDLNDVFTAELAENAENKHIFIMHFASAYSAISSVAGGEFVPKQ